MDSTSIQPPTENSTIKPEPSDEEVAITNSTIVNPTAAASQPTIKAEDPSSNEEGENNFDPLSSDDNTEFGYRHYHDDHDESEMSEDDGHSVSSDCDCSKCEKKQETIKSTVELIEIFKENDDKHHVNIPLDPLRGKENWFEWVIGIELVLRIYQVWPVAREDGFEPLARDHEDYHWSERMIDVAIAVIYAHVSDEVRKHKCFLSAVVRRDPCGVMNNLWHHYGGGLESEEHAHAH